MNWVWVVFSLGIALIISATVLGGIYLRFYIKDRKRKDEEYKQLKELLEKQQEREKR